MSKEQLSGKNRVKGNEAEEFIQKIVLKILFTVMVVVVGLGIALFI